MDKDVSRISESKPETGISIAGPARPVCPELARRHFARSLTSWVPGAIGGVFFSGSLAPIGQRQTLPLVPAAPPLPRRPLGRSLGPRRRSRNWGLLVLRLSTLGTAAGPADPRPIALAMQPLFRRDVLSSVRRRLAACRPPPRLLRPGDVGPLGTWSLASRQKTATGRPHTAAIGSPSRRSQSPSARTRPP